ncbi:hypothetical protein PanWU01x14_253390 [Parasponia andersonii]|uniref:Uncharacterized protein n=1 Tax=Parasponia andersonii TaxID=3476 RepID=A0A2P5BBR8_PARAD|nr:hypothetical protein PanWU01x14_253390 [Parasponia andersonii]
MRVEDQVISFNVFKEEDSSSDINDYYRVDLVKESIKDNSLKEAPLINHDASIIHLVDVEAKKSQESSNVVEALQPSSNSNPPIKVIEPLLSPSNHHKPYKKDTRKLKTKKKKHGDHHFEQSLRGVLVSSCLKLFLDKLNSRWSGPSKKTNGSLCGAIKVDNKNPTRRIKGTTNRDLAPPMPKYGASAPNTADFICVGAPSP